jgi:outer membrane protein
LERKVTFYQNGKASEAEVYEAKARVAQDELSAVQAENNYQLALLDLTQLLELPTPDGFQIATPELDITLGNLTLPEDIYIQALLNKPVIKAAQYRLEGADKTIRIAQSAYYPQLNFGAGLSTNYYNMSGIENASFSSQWHQNFNKYMQLSLSIPIFNRFSTRNRVKSAKIQKNALQWRLEETKKALYKEIQQAYYNALAAEAKFKSSQSASEAAEASFQLMNEKYANGKATATEYNEMRTNWMRALSDHIQARYDYLFRSKILDFYKGLPLIL